MGPWGTTRGSIPEQPEELCTDKHAVCKSPQASLSPGVVQKGDRTVPFTLENGILGQHWPGTHQTFW